MTTPNEQNEWEEKYCENICQDCNRAFEDWLTEGVTWSEVVGEYNGILCSYCFLERAASATPDVVQWYITPLYFAGAADSPDIKVRQNELERVYKLLESERNYFATQETTLRKEWAGKVVEAIDFKKQERPFDIIEESLVEIAAQSKSAAWVLGYNTALKHMHEDVLDIIEPDSTK